MKARNVKLPMPADFIEVQAGKSQREICAHYGASDRPVMRWLSEMPAEIIAARLKYRKELTAKNARIGNAAAAARRSKVEAPPMPDDFAGYAIRHGRDEASNYFGVTRATIAAWAAQVPNLTARRLAYVQQQAKHKIHAKRTQALGAYKVGGTLEMAKDHLRRYVSGNVFRAEVRYGPVKAGLIYVAGQPDPFLTPQQVIELAKRHGFQPDAWKALAA